MIPAAYICPGVSPVNTFQPGLPRFVLNVRCLSNKCSGGHKLDFVFVSACHSRPAGDAFLDAGVEHVICSEQKEQTLNNLAAIVFARDFYRALANGRTLQQAYDLAINAVKQSPDVPQAELEAKKFVLLPEGKDHNIHLFFDSENPPPDGASLVHRPLPSIYSGYTARSPPRRSNHSRLPVPPQIFLGRERDMYRITKSLFVKNSRLVSITGKSGIGKATVAKAVGQYITQRNMSRFEVLWMPPIGKGKDKIAIAWSELFHAIEDSKAPSKILSDDSYLVACQDLLDHLYDEKVLIIINAARMRKRNCIAKLCMFLDDLFERTKFTKVLLIHQEDASIQSRNPAGFSCLQESVVLEPLDFASTVSLFGRVCPHATSNRKNWSPDILAKKKSENTLIVLGQGNPTKTILAANKMSELEYKKLVGSKEEIRLEEFEATIKEVETTLLDSSGPEDVFSCGSNLVRTHETERPPLRSQVEVVHRFGPLLKREGLIYRKTESAYIRPAVKGEHIVAAIGGKAETEYIVKDDHSWVVCGKADGEHYVVTDKDFHNCYHQDSAKEIPPGTKDRTEKKLRRQGFLEYRSKRKVWAREVDALDMDWFRYGCPPSATGEAYFEA